MNPPCSAADKPVEAATRHRAAALAAANVTRRRANLAPQAV